MMPQLGLVLIVGFALIHAYASTLSLLEKVPEHYWVSAAGGIAISYIFLDIFPELSRVQETLEQSEIPFFAFFENHVYLLSLMGLTVFYGLEKLAFGRASENHSAAFWIHAVPFAIYNALLGYLLQNSMRQGHLVEALALFIALGLHLLTVDRGLRERHSRSYDRQGRWLLAGAVISGAVIRFSSPIDEATIGAIWGFVAGGTILNVLKEELPEHKKSAFGVFVGSGVIYSSILLVALPSLSK